MSNLDNFKKPSFISEVAIDKNKEKFLPRNIQIDLNNVLKDKLFRFYDELKVEENRPVAMQKFDSMVNDLKGQRMKDLYMYRRAGNHIVNLLCHSIPPELVYAIDNHVPVNVCMAAGELEPYADKYTQGMCPLTRSMIGLNNTGMCVFFNVADYAIGNKLCHNIEKAVDIFNKTSNDLDLFLIESEQSVEKIEVDFKTMEQWVEHISNGKGFNKEAFIKYAKLFTEIRETYKYIRTLRKMPNPPINGKNSLWIQQLLLVSEPNDLLASLKTLITELENNIKNNIGFNPTGKKKRVMLITPRIMPPFAEIFRVIENVDAIVVCEEMCMGISNITYNIDTLLEILKDDNQPFENAAKYILETIDQSECSCSRGFDFDRILNKIEEYQVDAVINYSFVNCPCMENKTQKINDLLTEKGIPSLNLTTDYIEIYDNAEFYMDKIKAFLKI
jgi:benzoyl-CoA reductase/2-hydroxyglutaryl-CoA dehydratase subunit BcrC/BadD/HgdB